MEGLGPDISLEVDASLEVDVSLEKDVSLELGDSADLKKEVIIMRDKNPTVSAYASARISFSSFPFSGSSELTSG